MSRNVSEAANGSGEITSHIAGVAQGRNRYPEGRAAAGWKLQLNCGDWSSSSR